MRQDRIGKADGLEHAHAFVVEMHRARQMIGSRLALQHQRPHAAEAEQVGERGADGAAADDHDVEVLRADLSCMGLSLPRAGATRFNAAAPKCPPSGRIASLGRHGRA